MRSLSVSISLGLASLLLIGGQCSSQEEILTSETLVGVWQGSGTAYDGVVQENTCTLFEQNVSFTFRSDGSHTFTGEIYTPVSTACDCPAAMNYEASYELNGTWNLDGALLTLTSSGSFDECAGSRTVAVDDIPYAATAELLNGALSFSVNDNQRPDYRLRRVTDTP